MRSLFSKKVFLGAALFLSLSGCGFSPIYGSFEPSDNQVAADLGRVAIAGISDREGQELRNHLIDRMYRRGRPSDPIATLDVSLRNSEVDLGILKDSTAARREINMWAHFTLTDKSGQKLLSGDAHSIVGYAKLSAQYGTLASRDDAIDRAVNEVGEQIVNRVSLYYASAAVAPASKSGP